MERTKDLHQSFQTKASAFYDLSTHLCLSLYTGHIGLNPHRVTISFKCNPFCLQVFVLFCFNAVFQAAQTGFELTTQSSLTLKLLTLLHACWTRACECDWGRGVELEAYCVSSKHTDNGVSPQLTFHFPHGFFQGGHIPSVL